MNELLLVVFAGLINWIVTTIIVEGVVFQGAREWLDAHMQWAGHYTELWHCHLCAGTWVGIGIAMLLPGPLQVALGVLSGPASVLLNGFLYKAAGHVILEATALMMNKNKEYRAKMELFVVEVGG